VLRRSLGLFALAGASALPVWSLWLEPARLRNEDHVLALLRHLFVASGVGTSIFPIRFRVPPEVSVLHLERAPRAGPR
jgi:predicted MPP superfamily phosphohydrolase